MRIFHVVHPAVWEQACAAGEYRPPSLEAEGFVHCSFADQVAETAQRHFAEADEDSLVVVEWETDDLTAPVRVEDAPGTGAGFPHVYGPVRTAAQTGSFPLRRGPDGRWTFDREQPGG